MLAILALAAVSSTTASAFTEFTAANGTLLATKGGPQEFSATAGVTITTKCAAMSAIGEVALLKTEVEQERTEFSGCKTAGLASTVSNGCNFTYNIDGLVDFGTVPNCKLLVEISVTKCKIEYTGVESFLKEAGYGNFESNKFETKSTIGGIKFESATGKNCGFKEAAVKGRATWTGSSVSVGSNVK